MIPLVVNLVNTNLVPRSPTATGELDLGTRLGKHNNATNKQRIEHKMKKKKKFQVSRRKREVEKCIECVASGKRGIPFPFLSERLQRRVKCVRNFDSSAKLKPTH